MSTDVLDNCNDELYICQYIQPSKILPDTNRLNLGSCWQDLFLAILRIKRSRVRIRAPFFIGVSFCTLFPLNARVIPVSVVIFYENPSFG